MPKEVVVTGCFQLLHEGHINLLRGAARYGEVTVLLNNDEGVLDLKGYLAEHYHDRARKLLDTGLVKQVVPIYTDPTEQLKRLRPDYQVCGSDHTAEEVMEKGGEYVGEVVILPYTEGISSTQLYKKEVSE